MNRATIPVKLPPSSENAARELAEEDGGMLRFRDSSGEIHGDIQGVSRSIFDVLARHASY
jgi:hypothetical protein